MMCTLRNEIRGRMAELPRPVNVEDASFRREIAIKDGHGSLGMASAGHARGVIPLLGK